MGKRTQLKQLINFQPCSNLQLLPHHQKMEQQHSSLLPARYQTTTQAISKLEKTGITV